MRRRTATASPMPEGQHPLVLEIAGQAEPMRMWLYLPRGYASSRRAWPLVVFLHGSDERGVDLDKVKVHGPPMLVDQGADYPFILCSPQLEDNMRWDADRLHALLAGLRERLRIDPRRVTATGLSLGGHGVWAWAAAHPEDLAAIAPVCGYADPQAVCRARDVPVRAYHGDADIVVPLLMQQRCVEALRACGASVDFIVYPGVQHDAWTPAYNDPALVLWLMSHARG